MRLGSSNNNKDLHENGCLKGRVNLEKKMLKK